MVVLGLALATPMLAHAQVTISRSIAASSDDAEEAGPDATGSHVPGYIDLTSTDIELIRDFDTSGGYSGGTQTIGLRFTAMTVPAGATITSAYLTFGAVSEDVPMTNAEPTNLTIRAELAPNPSGFTPANGNISSRGLTAASTSWAPGTWTAGTDYDSPSIVPVIQELVGQGGWASGNAMVIIISGSGHRASASYDGDPANAAQLVVTYATYALAGRVFEDVNYGGGAGRDRSTALAAGGSGRPNARVELYDGSGNYSTFATTNASGDYSFTGLVPGNYTVRVVNSSVSSARPGYVAGTHLSVQTFRTDASSGAAVAITDRVGGEAPGKADAGNGNTTLAALTTATTAAQSITAVTLGSADMNGIDFGHNFDVVVNTNNAGQGSLRQFLANSNALGADATLAQSGSRMSLGAVQPLPAGKESSIFMIADGAAHAGLNSGYANLLTGGVAVIGVTTLLPAINGANAQHTIVDGTTQTINVGNTNAAMLGAGGPVGVSNLGLPQIPGPEVQLIDVSNLARGIDIQAANVTLRGFAVVGFGNVPISANHNEVRVGSGASNALIEQNVVGARATAFADPGAAARSGGDQIYLNGSDNGIVRNNLVGFTSGIGIMMPGGNTNNQVVGNELRRQSIGQSQYHSFDLSGGVNNVIRGNLMVDCLSSAIHCTGSGGFNLYENNSFLNNAVAGSVETPGLTVESSDDRFDRNVIAGSYGAGIQVGAGSTGITITKNSIHTNGSTTGQIGIDLLSAADDADAGSAPFVTLNDAGDGDTGGNALQNFPTLTAVASSGSSAYITGTLNSTPSNSYTIEFFSSPAPDPSGYGEGTTYLGSTVVNTDASGSANISVILPGVTVPAGHAVTATSTNNTSRNTSEFGANVANVLDLDLDDDGIVNADEGDTCEPITPSAPISATSATWIDMNVAIVAGRTYAFAPTGSTLPAQVVSGGPYHGQSLILTSYGVSRTDYDGNRYSAAGVYQGGPVPPLNIPSANLLSIHYQNELTHLGLIDVNSNGTFDFGTDVLIDRLFLIDAPNSITATASGQLYALYADAGPANNGGDVSFIVTECAAEDHDGDGVPDAQDLDSDNDGVYDAVESGVGAAHTNGVLNGAVNPNGIPVAADTDGDGNVDYALDDSDGDGDPDPIELDSDGDVCGDVIEAGYNDPDGDGILGDAPVAVDGNGLVLP